MILFSRTALIDPEIQLRLNVFQLVLAFSVLVSLLGCMGAADSFCPATFTFFNHADFGLLLLCSGLGAMLAMPATGKIVQRVGCRVPIGFALLCLPFYVATFTGPRR